MPVCDEHCLVHALRSGLGLLAPLVTGAPIGVALGLVLHAKPGFLLRSTVLGIVIWSTILTLIAYYGVNTAKALFGS